MNQTTAQFAPDSFFGDVRGFGKLAHRFSMWSGASDRNTSPSVCQGSSFCDFGGLIVWPR
ncbi:MAG: hypothetical protein WA796_10000, partial [Pseudolabrys sp.]